MVYPKSLRWFAFFLTAYICQPCSADSSDPTSALVSLGHLQGQRTYALQGSQLGDISSLISRVIDNTQAGIFVPKPSPIAPADQYIYRWLATYGISQTVALSYEFAQNDKEVQLFSPVADHAPVIIKRVAADGWCDSYDAFADHNGQYIEQATIFGVNLCRADNVDSFPVIINSQASVLVVDAAFDKESLDQCDAGTLCIHVTLYPLLLTIADRPVGQQFIFKFRPKVKFTNFTTLKKLEGSQGAKEAISRYLVSTIFQTKEFAENSENFPPPDVDLPASSLPVISSHGRVADKVLAGGQPELTFYRQIISAWPKQSHPDVDTPDSATVNTTKINAWIQSTVPSSPNLLCEIDNAATYAAGGYTFLCGALDADIGPILSGSMQIEMSLKEIERLPNNNVQTGN